MRATVRQGIHWESDRCLAVVKPPGVPVFPPHADPNGPCVLAALLAARPEQAGSWPEGFAGGIAHRLDIPTSGMLLVAKTPADLLWLRELFADRALHKTYHLLTAKDPPWSDHTITAELAHDRGRKKRMVVRRGRDTPHRGRWLPAQTTLTRLEQAGGLWRWEAVMRTGVMHQIRAHAGFAGLALAGDRLYGGGETPPGFPVPFALHHLGLRGPGLSPPPVPPPLWWDTAGEGV
jgi:23S rRNA pseudouridine1911/1915/1917 synthase